MTCRRAKGTLSIMGVAIWLFVSVVVVLDTIVVYNGFEYVVVGTWNITGVCNGCFVSCFWCVGTLFGESKNVNYSLKDDLGHFYCIQ
jgi:hypothetical protein